MPGCRSAGAQALNALAVRGAWRMGNGTILTLAANFGAERIELELAPGKLLFTSGETPAANILPPRTTLAFLADAA